MIRRLLAPALLLPLVLVPHAGAASAGVSDAAYVTMDLTVGGSTYRLDLLAARPTALGTGGADELRLQVTGEDGYTKYVAALPSSALTLTDTGADLRAELAGTPLHVTWTTGTDPGAFGGGGDGITAGAGDDGSVVLDLGYTVEGSPATATFALGKLRCSLSTFVLVGTAVGDDAAAAQPLGEAFDDLDLTGATCRDVEADVAT